MLETLKHTEIRAIVCTGGMYTVRIVAIDYSLYSTLNLSHLKIYIYTITMASETIWGSSKDTQERRKDNRRPVALQEYDENQELMSLQAKVRETSEKIFGTGTKGTDRDILNFQEPKISKTETKLSRSKQKDETSSKLQNIKPPKIAKHGNETSDVDDVLEQFERMLNRIEQQYQQQDKENEDFAKQLDSFYKDLNKSKQDGEYGHMLCRKPLCVNDRAICNTIDMVAEQMEDTTKSLKAAIHEANEEDTKEFNNMVRKLKHDLNKSTEQGNDKLVNDMKRLAQQKCIEMEDERNALKQVALNQNINFHHELQAINNRLLAELDKSRNEEITEITKEERAMAAALHRFDMGIKSLEDQMKMVKRLQEEQLHNLEQQLREEALLEADAIHLNSARDGRCGSNGCGDMSCNIS